LPTIFAAWAAARAPLPLGAATGAGGLLAHPASSKNNPKRKTRPAIPA
jgi:hypothetical protein